MSERSRLTRSAQPTLAVLLNGALAGHVYKAANRRLVFKYDSDWTAQRGAFPLSLSMPLQRLEHGHRATSAFLWGLLPDDPRVIEFWARQLGSSRTDVVALLAHVGEDCAGAVQIIPSERTDSALGPPSAADQKTSVEWLSIDDVEQLLIALRQNPALSRTSNTQGRFSLAGAQPKTTLYHDRGRWGIPKGRVPSTHILKPPVLDLDDLAYNEHVCLQLARELGLTAANTSVQRFGNEIAIVVERYDRVRIDGVLMRVHQEDMCQALAVQPTVKYETDGGPSLTDVAALLARHSSEPLLDVAHFIEANVFNWLIAGPDAHAKNYSVLHAAGPEHRFAPLYDVITTLPYPALSPNGVTLAMAVAGERRVASITGNHWRIVARAVELPPQALLDRIVELGERIPAAIDRVLVQHAADKPTRSTIAKLMEPVSDNVTRCLKRL
ncbi:MAG: type II toxin-antitoxin system HipA family toxin [Gemmatimonadaceae bacterium]